MSNSSSSIDRLVDATPDTRDRYVDFLRAVSLAVVVMWHWVFSVTHWSADGRLTMPNPIGQVRLLWLATWVLQIIPVFFFVGGFSNLTAWTAHRRDGRGDRAFLSSRLRRLLRPVGVFVGAWVVGDGLARLIDPSLGSVFAWGRVVFVPLWFIGVYFGVVLLVPLTARLHRRAAPVVIVMLGGAVAMVDLARFRWDAGWLAYANGALVFLFAHQLGYFYADGTLSRWTRSQQWALTLAGAFGLCVLTNLGVYERSMVAVRGGRISNLNPPTAAIACLTIFQVGLVLLARPAVTRWLGGRRPWKAVVAANAVAMTVFAWHMTAYVLAIGVVQRLGGTMGSRATGTWWIERPLWVVVPALFLIPFVAVAARIEQSSFTGITPARRPRRRSVAGAGVPRRQSAGSTMR